MDRVAAVSTFVTETVAPGRIAFDWSRTVPEMLPVVDWARAEAAASTQARHTSARTVAVTVSLHRMKRFLFERNVLTIEPRNFDDFLIPCQGSGRGPGGRNLRDRAGATGTTPLVRKPSELRRGSQTSLRHGFGDPRQLRRRRKRRRREGGHRAAARSAGRVSLSDAPGRSLANARLVPSMQDGPDARRSVRRARVPRGRGIDARGAARWRDDAPAPHGPRADHARARSRLRRGAREAVSPVRDQPRP